MSLICIHFELLCLFVSKLISNKLCLLVLTSFCGSRQYILVFIHKKNATLSFLFRKSIGMSTMGVEATDVFFHLTTANTQLMN